ncbi:MAG: Serine/threonine-protein kinase PknB [candidate division BRC1 bacterium ADurb.BinA364]|nr:MAG: Serine/threonine-protein kinase PknB [candidate division BRC1 bacterium ADurb.BinA364]
MRHPHIVNVIDQGEVGDILYMAMEYVEGKTLDKYLRDKPLEKRIELFIQICQALDYAHAQGILHRDIKPANILVTHDETTKLLDFGIAQLRQSARESQLTQSNIVMGTPRYMAPEQMSDFHNIDGRADLYSVGVMMLEIFGETKDWPDASVNPRELNPEIPEPLAQAIQKCLARRPHERYASMADLGRFLCEFLERCKSGPIRQEAPLSEEEAQAALFRERFQIISSIRDDAQCSVALAEHKTLKRLILIKTCRNAANVNALKTLIKLRHPHVCEIFGMKEDGYKLSVVTEYLNGGTLGERMRAAGKIAADRAVGYLLPVAEALQFAHGYRIRHGHLHPDNVLIDENGAVKVTDFAMPSHCSGSMQRYSNANIADGYARDRFALGVMLFEMLTGEKYVAARGPQRNFALLENVKIQPANLKLALQKLWNIAPNQACYVDSKQLADELRAMADHLWRREQADSPGEQAAIPSKSLEAAHAATAPAEWPAGLIIGLAAAAALGLAGLLAVLAKLFG